MASRLSPERTEKLERGVDGSNGLHAATPLPVPPDQSRLNRPGRSWAERNPYIWFILPALIVYSALFIFPTAWAFVLSVFDWSGKGPITNFIWLDNFRDALRSRQFHQA